MYFHLMFIWRHSTNLFYSHVTLNTPVDLVLVPLQRVVHGAAHAAGHDVVRRVGSIVLRRVRWRPVVQVVDLGQGSGGVRVSVHGCGNSDSVHRAAVMSQLIVLR